MSRDAQRRFMRLCAKRRTEASKKFPYMRTVALRLEDDPTMRSGRDFAYCEYDNHQPRERVVRIVMHPRLANQPLERQEGILRHELAHAVDALYSAREIEEKLGLPPLPSGAEQRADDIASALWPEVIVYDGEDVQTIGVGQWPRPGYLPR